MLVKGALISIRLMYPIDFSQINQGCRQYSIWEKIDHVLRIVSCTVYQCVISTYVLTGIGPSSAGGQTGSYRPTSGQPEIKTCTTTVTAWRQQVINHDYNVWHSNDEMSLLYNDLESEIVGKYCCVLFFFFLSIYLIFYYPRPVMAFGYCRCLRLSVCVCVCVCVCPSIISLSGR